MPQVRGWSEDEIERRSLNLAVQLRRAWRAIIKSLIAKTSATITLADLGNIPKLWASQVDPNLLGHIGTALYDGVDRVLEDTGAPYDVIAIEDFVEKYLQTATNRLVNIGDDVWGDVRAQLLVGHGLNEDYGQLAARVKHTAQVSDARALRIARTEMHAALEAGSYEQALLVDPNGKKTWIATEDERTRPSHHNADGQVVKISDWFNVGGASLRYPGDPTGPAGEIINCRCSTLFDLDLEPSDIITSVSDEVMTAAGKFDETEHPRGHDGKFIEKGSLLYKALLDPSDIQFQYAVNKLTGSDWGKLTSPQKAKILKHAQDLHLKHNGAGFTQKTLDAVTQLAKTGGIKSPDQVKVTSSSPLTKIVPSGTSAVPADIYKQWPDGHVVAITKDGDFRLVWDAEKKKYLHQSLMAGGIWTTPGPPLTKKLAYNEIMGNKQEWYKPGKSNGLVPSPSPSPSEPEIKELSLPKLKSPFHVVPKEQRGKSGDGYAAPGLWGKYGAAGVMIRNVGPDGVERFLMVQRGPGVSSNVGKWQLPGGALEEHETPEQGAAREIFEEVGASDSFLAGMKHAGTHAIEVPVPGQKPWVYSNIGADSPEMFEPKVDGTETGDAKWMTREDIAFIRDSGKLHPALDKNLDQVFGLFDPPKPMMDSEDQFSMDASSPTDLKSFKKISGQKGSNLGGVYEAPDGTRYYVKKAKSEMHARNDVLASKLYGMAGIDVPQVYVGKNVEGLGSIQTFTKIVPDSHADLSVKRKDSDYLAKIQDGFAVDAWLANWDVAGMGYDNIVTDGNGNPVRIDTGGSLLYRAQGDVKGAQFGDTVDELSTLRDSSTNPQAATLFGVMSVMDIRQSAIHVKSVTPEQIDVAVQQAGMAPATADKLKKRREYILKKYPPDLALKSPLTPKAPATSTEDVREPMQLEMLDDMGISSQKDWMALSPSEKDEVINDLITEGMTGDMYIPVIKSWEPDYFATSDNGDGVLDSLVPTSDMDQYVMKWDHDIQDATAFSEPGAVLAATADGNLRVKYNPQNIALSVEQSDGSGGWYPLMYVSLYDEDMASTMDDIKYKHAGHPNSKWVNTAGIDYLGLDSHVSDKQLLPSSSPLASVHSAKKNDLLIPSWLWPSMDQGQNITSKYDDGQLVAQSADGKMKITWHDDDNGYRVSKFLNTSQTWMDIETIPADQLADANLDEYGAWYKSPSVGESQLPSNRYANTDGTPNWHAIKVAVQNGSIPTNTILARSGDDQLRIRKHHFPAYLVMEQHDPSSGEWVPVETINGNHLAHTAENYSPYHGGWISSDAPQPIQYEPPALPNIPDKTPTGDISSVSQVTKTQIAAYFKAQDAKWHSKSQHIWDTIQQYKQGIVSKNGGQANFEGIALSDLQILAVLDSQLKKTDSPYVTKMTKWLGTPAGKKHATSTKADVISADPYAPLGAETILSKFNAANDYDVIAIAIGSSGTHWEMRKDPSGYIGVYRDPYDTSNWHQWTYIKPDAYNIAQQIKPTSNSGFGGLTWLATPNIYQSSLPLANAPEIKSTFTPIEPPKKIFFNSTLPPEVVINATEVKQIQDWSTIDGQDFSANQVVAKSVDGDHMIVKVGYDYNAFQHWKYDYAVKKWKLSGLEIPKGTLAKEIKTAPIQAWYLPDGSYPETAVLKPKAAEPSVLDQNFAIGFPKFNQNVNVDAIFALDSPLDVADADALLGDKPSSGSILAYGKSDDDDLWRMVYFKPGGSAQPYVTFQRKNIDGGAWATIHQSVVPNGDVSDVAHQSTTITEGLPWYSAYNAPLNAEPAPGSVIGVPSNPKITPGLATTLDNVDLDAIHAKGLKFHPAQMKHQLTLASNGSVLAYGKTMAGYNARMVYGDTPNGVGEIVFQVQDPNTQIWASIFHTPANSSQTELIAKMADQFKFDGWKNSSAVPLKPGVAPKSTSITPTPSTPSVVFFPHEDTKNVDLDAIYANGVKTDASHISHQATNVINGSVLAYGLDKYGHKARIVYKTSSSHTGVSNGELRFQIFDDKASDWSHAGFIPSNASPAQIAVKMGDDGGFKIDSWKNAENAPIKSPTPTTPAGKSLAVPEFASHPQLKLADGNTIPKTKIVDAWGPFTKKSQYSKYTDTVIAYSTDGKERLVYTKSSYFSRQKWDEDQQKWKHINAEVSKVATLAKGQKWYPAIQPVTVGKAKNYVSQTSAFMSSTPAGKLDMGDGTIDHLTDAQRLELYKEFRAHGVYSTSTPHEIFKAIKAVADPKGLTYLQVLRAVDDARAVKNKIPNENKYEKLITNWLATPQGYAQALNKTPPLPPRPKYISGVDPDTQVPSFEESSKYEYNHISLSATMAWWKEMLEAHGTPWTASQKAGLKAYTGGISYGMNAYLYGKPGATSISSSVSTSMHQAQLSMRPSIKPVLLFRSVGYDALRVKNHDELEALVGQTRSQDGFNSTSVGSAPAGGSGGVVIEVEAPPGTPMAWAHPISLHPSENEMLLGAGIHYKILKVWKSGNYGQSRVRVRVVPPPEGVTS